MGVVEQLLERQGNGHAPNLRRLDCGSADAACFNGDGCHCRPKQSTPELAETVSLSDSRKTIAITLAALLAVFATGVESCGKEDNISGSECVLVARNGPYTPGCEEPSMSNQRTDSAHVKQHPASIGIKLEDLPKCGGVYFICNNHNGKVYVGSSTNIRRRATHHRTSLRGKRHCNRHLQFAWLKYGELSFSWGVLEESSATGRPLAILEQHYIDLLKSADRSCGYNLQPDAVHRTFSQETRDRMSDARRGQPAWNKGIPCPEHVKKINSLFHKGRTRSPETCAKLSAAILACNHQYRGKSLPDVVKEKISDSQHQTGPKSGEFKGVSLDRRTGTFMARIYANGRQRFLGRFKTAEQAAAAYNDAALSCFGPGCHLNDIGYAVRPVRRTTKGRPPGKGVGDAA